MCSNSGCWINFSRRVAFCDSRCSFGTLSPPMEIWVIKQVCRILATCTVTVWPWRRVFSFDRFQEWKYNAKSIYDFMARHNVKSNRKLAFGEESPLTELRISLTSASNSRQLISWFGSDTRYIPFRSSKFVVVSTSSVASWPASIDRIFALFLYKKSD